MLLLIPCIVAVLPERMRGMANQGTFPEAFGRVLRHVNVAPTGYVVDRIGKPTLVFGAVPVAASPFIVLLGLAERAVKIVLPVVFSVGCCVNALVGCYYPAAMRAIGVSWVFAIDRLGSIVGAVLAGRSSR